MKSVFMYGAAGFLALAVLGIGAVSLTYGQEEEEEEPCLGVVGETVEGEVETTNQTLNDPSSVVEEEVQFVEDGSQPVWPDIRRYRDDPGRPGIGAGLL
jgi:hypothetical protein